MRGELKKGVWKQNEKGKIVTIRLINGLSDKHPSYSQSFTFFVSYSFKADPVSALAERLRQRIIDSTPA